MEHIITVKEPVATYYLGFTFMLWGSDDADEWTQLGTYGSWDSVVKEFKDDQPYSHVMITGGIMAKRDRWHPGTQPSEPDKVIP